MVLLVPILGVAIVRDAYTSLTFSLIPDRDTNVTDLFFSPTLAR